MVSVLKKNIFTIYDEILNCKMVDKVYYLDKVGQYIMIVQFISHLTFLSTIEQYLKKKNKNKIPKRCRKMQIKKRGRKFLHN